MRVKKALLIVDVQNDFCLGGALAVPGGNKVVTVLNKYISYFNKRGLPIFVSRDWHPRKTRHFKKFGGIWPEHCLMSSKGARFHPKLILPEEVIIISKGMHPREDSYSCFQAKDKNDTNLLNILKIIGINELYIGGLATDYCVKFSVLDALKNGFKVRLLTDAIKGVNIKPNDSSMAIKMMFDAGAKSTTFNQLL